MPRVSTPLNGSDGAKILFEGDYPTTLVACRSLRQDLFAMLESTPVSSSRRNDLLLAVSEAFTNIVRHGAPSPRAIKLKITRAPKMLRLCLIDDGGAFLGFDDARGDETAHPPSVPSESGMGMGLIFNLGGTVGYTSTNGLNTLEFVETIQEPVPPRVVVVDDDASTRNLIAAYLEDGYQVQTFSEAHDALRSILADRPDLIISDISMPGLDGFGLRRRLQADESARLVPFIFLTGLENDALEHQATGLDVDDYLEKPMEMRKLLNVAERAIRRARRLRDQAGFAVDRKVTDALKSDIPARIGPFNISTLQEVASAGGGDLITHYRGSDWTTFLLLDVMGHGVQAKIFGYAYTAYLQSILRDPVASRSPSDVLSQLSHRISEDNRLDETIVTCVAATLHDDGRVEVAVAGHPRPYLRTAGSLWRTIPVTGALPGLMDERPVSQAFQLGSGDSLLLVTDGLGEALSRDHPEDALLQLLASVDDGSQNLLEKLDEVATDTARSANTELDDRTAVLLTFDEFDE